MRTRATRRTAGGFTLAEVAVTIALVGLAMVYMLQGLSTAKMTAAYTRNLKLSKELALLTLGRIEAGLYEEELDDERIDGSYADEGYPEFTFQAVIGDENLPELYDDEQGFFDNWSWEDDQDDDDDDEIEQPYEKIQIRVISPPIRDLQNELVIERWVAWEQLHPPEEDEDDDE